MRPGTAVYSRNGWQLLSPPRIELMPTALATATQTSPEDTRPVVPDRLEDLGISRSLVTDLILRYLWLHGSGTLGSLHDRLKLSFGVLEIMFHQFRQQHILEVKGMLGNDYMFSLTNTGRDMAVSRNEVCQYVGPAPVSLQQYHQVVKSQSAHIRLSRESLRQAFSDLVLPDKLLDQLGPSLIGHQSLFLYGGTGNGKTSIAERILRIYRDTVLVPYAVEVDGHIICVFDPVVHRVAASDDHMLDPRWVRCERPCITVGGELVASMLELQVDEQTRSYISPCQMKANNGILIIDDFGRQVLKPRELLNRWVVPLDRRVDYLSLTSGMKFQVPFELMVVFSTNLNPRDLADEAFLRRIETKVLVENVQPDVFDRIFERVLDKYQAPAEKGCAEYLRERCHAAGAKYLRACYPNDICRLVTAISEYEGRAMRMTRVNIDRAVALYFAKDETGEPLE